MGKTNIFLMLAAHRLKLFPSSKILLIGPTRPLIDQYERVFRESFDIEPDKLAVFTGFVPPEKRAELWRTAKIIFSTPQGLENDIITNRINLEEVSLLGIDEAHRAVGDYAYVFIAKQYHERAKFPRIIAMTASPGSDIETINEIVQNLFIEAIEIRTEDSPDVRQYVQEVNVKWIKVEFPEEYRQVHKSLTSCYNKKLQEIKSLGYLSQTPQSKKDILSMQARLQGELASGTRDFSIMRALSLAAEALKVQHAIELIETQGAHQLNRYMEQIEMQARTTKTRAVQNLVKDPDFRMALVRSRLLAANKVDHPKLVKLAEIIENKKDQRVMVFTQYRDSGQGIVEKLSQIQGINARLFVGQQKKNGTGLTQKRQIEILEEFRNDKFNVLVATSVGEEGLDIPQVDLVIFYEPIPSAIRSIQRRGRTGRLEKGEVIILSTKDTRDEAYRWSAHHKEARMYRNLEGLKKKILFRKFEGQESLKRFEQSDITVFADYREKGSGVIKELISLGLKVQMERLDTADYVVSARCGIEFKTQEDFVDSLIDGRLLQQVKALKQSFERPLILVQGDRDIYSIRNVHANAIRGLIAAIAVSYNVPILFSRTIQESASFISIIAKREQEEGSKPFVMHSAKPAALREQQEYLVSSLPGVGASLAKPLLARFGSAKNVFNASEIELKEVDLIGEKKAKAIRAVLDTPWEG